MGGEPAITAFTRNGLAERWRAPEAVLWGLNDLPSEMVSRGGAGEFAALGGEGESSAIAFSLILSSTIGDRGCPWGRILIFRGAIALLTVSSCGG